MSKLNIGILEMLYDSIEIEIEQDRGEICWAMDEVREYLDYPRLICEIGSAYGGNLMMLSSLLHNDGRIISIEPEVSRNIPGRIYPINKEYILPMISPIELYHIRGFSNDPDTIKGLETYLDGDRIDVLFIDGDHEYVSTRSDWDNYIRFMSSPSCVIFHDLVGGTQGPTQFFPELLARGYVGKSMCNNSDRYGIGIVYIGG